MNYATYCPEDDKLRLYIGRVPREEYLQLKKEGWTSTPTQDCDFVAVWTPQREQTAMDYGDGVIEDDDQSPQDRAADRAERFSGYREKREEEAHTRADSYDAGPSVHGYQSQALAERRAARHDLQAGRACNQWEKAEYWQNRTAGVIANALYKSAPGVRMGRIKKLEADLRKAEKNRAEVVKLYKIWEDCNNTADPEEQNKKALLIANYYGGAYCYKHPDQEHQTDYEKEHGTSLYSLLTRADHPITGKQAAELYLNKHHNPEEKESSYINHIKLRLAYENQMLQEQGGRAADLDFEPGGWLGNKQIQKVNKSPATGRVTSVSVWGERRMFTKGSGYTKEENVPVLLNIETERLAKEVYRAPTAEEKAAFSEQVKAEKAKAKATKPKTPPLINPTDKDAERLQDQWNAASKTSFFSSSNKFLMKEEDFQGSSVIRMTQAEYSAKSKGSYALAETRNICHGGKMEYISYCRNVENRPICCKLRCTYGNGNTSNKADSIIIITDKPQKPLPPEMWKVKKELEKCA